MKFLPFQLKAVLSLGSLIAVAGLASAQWATLDGSAHLNDDAPYGITVDKDDNVIVVGTLDQGATGLDLVVAKFNPAGALQWERLYDGPDHMSDIGLQVDTDASGNVCVCGTSQSAANADDIITRVYDPSGNVLWSKRYAETPGTYNDEPVTAKFDHAGHIYVLAMVETPIFARYATLKYNVADGSLAWKRTMNRYTSSDAVPVGLAVDLNGGAVVTGYSSGSGWGDDFLTARYDSSGAKHWTRIYNGAAKRDDIPCGLVIDSNNNVYIASTSYGKILASTPDKDFLLVKYDIAGNLIWVRRLDTGVDEVAIAVAIDSNDNVVMTGFRHPVTGEDVLTVEYSPAGVKLWQKSFSSPGTEDDYGFGLGMDRSDNVFVGCNLVDSGQYHMNLAKYNSVGVKLATHEAGFASVGQAVAVDSLGRAYAVGKNNDIVIFKF